MKWFPRSVLQDGSGRKKRFNDKSAGSVLPQPSLSLWTNAIFVPFIALL